MHIPKNCWDGCQISDWFTWVDHVENQDDTAWIVQWWYVEELATDLGQLVNFGLILQERKRHRDVVHNAVQANTSIFGLALNTLASSACR